MKNTTKIALVTAVLASTAWGVAQHNTAHTPETCPQHQQMHGSMMGEAGGNMQGQMQGKGQHQAQYQGQGMKGAQGGQTQGMKSTPTTVAAKLSDTETRAVISALTDAHGEYAAYATYDAIVQKYGNIRPYANILRSEQQHINMLVSLLKSSGVEVPANTYLGKITLPEDLKAIAKEEMDTEKYNVALYDTLLKNVAGNTTLTRVFNNLRSASLNNHLPAFERAYNNGGSF